MLIIAGSVDMTIGDVTRTLGVGDVAVVNRGVEHELYSPAGVTFVEALSPVPLDHVPDRLGPLLSLANARHRPTLLAKHPLLGCQSGA